MILNMARLNFATKSALGFFLCLSFFMIICAIVRIAGFRHEGLLDYQWQNFWLHVEACIAVIMGSVTIFPTAVVSAHANSDANLRQPPLAYLSLSDIRKRFWPKRQPDGFQASSREALSQKKHLFKLPVIPSATFSGLRTLLGKTNRTEDTQMTESNIDLVEIDYHAFVKSSPSADLSKVSEGHSDHHRAVSDGSSGK
jgi:hypothetical protein